MSRPRWSEIQQFCRKQEYKEDRTTRYLELFLRDVEHLSPEHVATMSLDEAKARWLAYHSRELLDP